MEFEVKRKVKKEVEETYVVRLEEDWVIRIVGEEFGSKCVKEEYEYPYAPDEQDIAEKLSLFNNEVFAVVDHRYKLVERGDVK